MKKYYLINVFMFAVLGILSILTAGISGIAGVSLALVTPGGIVNPDVWHFRTNLQTKVGKEIWYKGRIGAFGSFIDYDKFEKTGQIYASAGSRPPAEAIVHIVRDFKSKKGAKIEIPLIRPLTGQGKTGTQTLKKSGELRKILNTKCAINMKRHAVVVRDNEMSEQMTDAEIAIALYESGGNDLKDWFSRWMPFEMYFALMTGYSTNLTDSTYGLGYSQRSHPNFYVQDDGQVAFKTSSGTHVARTFDSGYEVNCATALATLSAGVDADKFSTQSIRNIVFLANKIKMQPVKKGGMSLIVIFITPAHARQLREDEVWQKNMREAWDRGQKNPIFTSEVEGYIYEGAYLIIDDTLPAARITGDDGFVAAESSNGLSTGVHYIKSNFMDEPRDSSPRKCAIACGVGALTAAEGKSFRLTEEVDDHDQWIEHGGRMIYGYTRPDIIDDDNVMGNGAGLFYDNQSSLEYWTYSEDDITI
jgi:hypothetical protein